jgi:hypothetical protein
METTDLFTVSIMLSFPECYVFGIIQHAAFSDWPLLLMHFKVPLFMTYYLSFFFFGTDLSTLP